MILLVNDFCNLFLNFQFYILNHNKDILLVEIHKFIYVFLNFIFKFYDHIYYHIQLFSKDIFNHELVNLYKLFMLGNHYFGNEFF